MALVLILIFSVNLKILPSSGAYSTGKAGDVGDRVIHLIMPLTIVVLEHLWYYAYMILHKRINLFIDSLADDITENNQDS